VSMESPHVPSGFCNTANVNAGRCVNGSDLTSSGIGLPSLATSVIARNLMGADACSISHVKGKTTDGDDGPATWVSGVADGLGLVGSWGGRVTEKRSLQTEKTGRARRVEGVLLKGGKVSCFESLR
jgi:hypothetical protein